jgi:hypothetical protein
MATHGDGGAWRAPEANGFFNMLVQNFVEKRGAIHERATIIGT